MMKETSTLILTDDTNHKTVEKDAAIKAIVQANLEKNKNHTIVVIDTSDLPKIVVLSGEPKEEVLLQENSSLVELVYSIILKRLRVGNVTVLAYVRQNIKDWIELKANLSGIRVEKIS